MMEANFTRCSARERDASDIAGERPAAIRTLTGYAASQGVAIGHCRVISGMEDLEKVGEGDILVCEAASPRLAIVMPKLGGLVAAHGGTLTAAAGYAREYNVPAVVGVMGLTETIHDGDVIRVDGTNGLVELLRKKI